MKPKQGHRFSYPRLPDPVFRLLRLLLAALLTGLLLHHSGLSPDGQWPGIALLTLYLLAFGQLATLLAQLDAWYIQQAHKRHKHY